MPYPPNSGGYNQPNWSYWTNPFEPGSAQGDWASNVAWGTAGQPYNWQTGTFDPENPFGNTYYNQAGEAFQVTPGMELQNQTNLQEQMDQFIANHGWISPGNYSGIEIGGQSFASMDPQGNLVFNPSAAFSGLNSGSNPAGGYDFSDYPGYVGLDLEGNQIAQVDPYSVEDFSSYIVDTNAVINAALPGIYEQQDIGFANAGNRAGQSGFAMSTPYAEALGGVARKSANDIAALTEGYRYNASEAFAQRQMEEQLQERTLQEAAWEAQNQMNIQAQMANQQAAIQDWMGQNTFNQTQWQNQNTLGAQDFWNSQQLTMQQQQQMQQAIADMMASVMGQTAGGNILGG